jgi:Putative mono-oxygenase ydhR
MPTLLQIDFPMQGPWGDEMATAFGDLASIIGRTPGLRWKIWTENEDEGASGGIYLFEDEDSARAYLEEHTARLESFGIEEVRARMFHVNEPLTAVTRGPLAPDVP